MITLAALWWAWLTTADRHAPGTPRGHCPQAPASADWMTQRLSLPAESRIPRSSA
jgi:hypothetical protein